MKKQLKVFCLTDKYKNFRIGQDVTEGFRYIQDIKPIKYIDSGKKVYTSIKVQIDKKHLYNTKEKELRHFHYISIQDPKTKNVQLFSLKNFKIAFV